MMHGTFSYGLVWILLAWLTASAGAEDWPTYRRDAARSGVSGEKLAWPLQPLWVYVPPAEPIPAWSRPQEAWGEKPKLDFDDAFHVAMAGDTVYFGSSVDNAIHALNADTGARRWHFVTDGPVRLAPTVADGRVYAGSDDGAVYCLEAQGGRLVWKQQPIGNSKRILGAGRVMSLWPIRTGVLVDGGVAYCGAGIFPASGTAAVALDATNGKVLWNTSKVPRLSYASLAPQGHLLMSTNQVYLPNGRTAPLAYGRADGELVASMERAYTIVAAKGVVSGGYGVLIDDLLYLGSQNVLHAYKPDGSHAGALRDASQLVATRDRFFYLSDPPPRPANRPGPEQVSMITAVDRTSHDQSPRRGTIPDGAVRWSYRAPNLQSIIVAGPNVLVGGANEVIALDGASGKVVWKAKVDGLARGLAVAQGRLVVSTDKGRIHCFGRGTPRIGPKLRTGDPFAAEGDGTAIAARARLIADDSKVTRGYGLVIGGEQVRLAYELAKRTGLLIHVVETDAARAVKSREALLNVGGLGAQVVVDLIKADASYLPYPPYFANLIVIDGQVLGKGAATAKEILRILKPYGGALYAGVKAPDPAWARAGTVSPFTLSGNAGWIRLVRGPLPGAANWTHQYANPGNTGSSDDHRVVGKPEVLWYGEPGPDKVQDRHRRSEAPLSLDGRVFLQGLRSKDNMPLLLSFDAYNGVPYWERPMPGAERIYILQDCGNLACSGEGLFVAVGKECHRLDLFTGVTQQRYGVPVGSGGSVGNWAYVAVEGDTLVGSASSAYQFSNTIFAYDLKSGKLRWRYQGGVIRNATIAVHDGKVLFVEHRGRDTAPIILDPLTKAKAEQAKRLGKVNDSQTQPVAPKPAEPYLRTVVALDLVTGRETWARDVDLTGCGGWAGVLCLIAKNEVALLCGVYSAYGRAKGDEDSRRALAISTRDGSTLWNQPIGNRVRPVVVGNTIIARPKAYLLETGEPAMRQTEKGTAPWRMANTGACGQISASAGMLFYRDGSTAIVDAATGGRLLTFTGMRPGCLINIVPAGGVAVQVEASSGCTCYHTVQGTITFVPTGAE